MNLQHHPELLDRLAAAYALGTLRAGARRRFESIARQTPAVRAAALLWQERFAAMTELQGARAPDPNVWKRIENMLAAQRAQPSAPVPLPEAGGWRRAMGLWRGAAIAAGMAAAGALGVAVHLFGEVREGDLQLARAEAERGALAQHNAQLAGQLLARPEIRYVAVLHDERATATLLVTFDPAHSTLTVKRVASYQEAPDRSLQLWALPTAGSPRSLGVLGEGAVMRLAAARDQVAPVPTLAVTLEPRGGVQGGPTGPVLFKGALLQAP